MKLEKYKYGILIFILIPLLMLALGINLGWISPYEIIAFTIYSIFIARTQCAKCGSWNTEQWSKNREGCNNCGHDWKSGKW